MKTVILPSGAELQITPAPFREAKALWQAILAELRDVRLESTAQMGGLIKDALCATFSSPSVERALFECFKRCTYNGNRITDPAETFEPVETREDFLAACREVGLENVFPFTKSLLSAWKDAQRMIGNILSSSSQTKS